MTKIYLLRLQGNIHKMGDNEIHFAGCPYNGPDEHNLDKARTFKTERAAKATNEFRYDGYKVVPAQLKIELI
jgi:hypothetical protein